jgi:hypothetical protein
LRWLDPFDPEEAAGLVLKVFELHCSFPETRECTADSVLQYLKGLLYGTSIWRPVEPGLVVESEIMDGLGGDVDRKFQVDLHDNRAHENQASTPIDASESILDASSATGLPPSPNMMLFPEFGFSIEAINEPLEGMQQIKEVKTHV